MIDRDRAPIFDVIKTVLSEFRLDNMADENGLPYPLVDLMSNPAPDDIGTGLAQMDRLAWEIEDAVIALLSAARDEGRAEGLGGALKAEQVEWVVNDIAELGVKIGDQFFFLYKGRSLVYDPPEHDDGSPMHWRLVGKREFGECAHPINYADPRLIGTASLDDSDDWRPLPAPPASQIKEG